MQEGDFSAKAISWDFGIGDKGDYIGVEVMLTDGENKGHSLTWYGNFSDETAGDPPKTRSEWTRIDLQKMGWDGKDLIALDGMGSRPFRVKIGMYKDKPQIKRIMAAGGLAIPADRRMSEAQKKALAAKVMNGGTPAPKEPKPQFDENGDKIPF